VLPPQVKLMLEQRLGYKGRRGYKDVVLLPQFRVLNLTVLHGIDQGFFPNYLTIQLLPLPRPASFSPLQVLFPESAP
jgi:hypothetical protein